MTFGLADPTRWDATLSARDGLYVARYESDGEVEELQGHDLLGALMFLRQRIFKEAL